MFNLLKYELKSNIRLIAGMIVALIAWNIFLLTKTNIWQNGATVAASLGATLILFIVIFIQGIKLLKQDLYDNTGYLVFTLPKKGVEIIGAKLIFALVEFLIFGVLASTLFLLQVSRLPEVDFSVITGLMSSHIAVTIYFAIGAVVMFASLLILCYFSMTISRVALEGRKFGTAASFGVFIALSWIIERLQTSVVKVFPYTIPLKINEFRNLYTGFNSFNIDLNIAFILSFVVIYTALFLGTSYLIDNKVDL